MSFDYGKEKYGVGECVWRGQDSFDLSDGIRAGETL